MKENCKASIGSRHHSVWFNVEHFNFEARTKQAWCDIAHAVILRGLFDLHTHVHASKQNSIYYYTTWLCSQRARKTAMQSYYITLYMTVLDMVRLASDNSVIRNTTMFVFLPRSHRNLHHKLQALQRIAVLYCKRCVKFACSIPDVCVLRTTRIAMQALRWLVEIAIQERKSNFMTGIN